MTIGALVMKHSGKVIDKWEHYLHAYDLEFCGLDDRSINILEIGVQNGGSLELWAKRFPKALSITGIDIDPKVGELVFDDPRISTEILNAGSTETLRQALDGRVFDLVIDDGSHRCSDVISAATVLLHHVAHGGKYIVEDLHCSYGKTYGGGFRHPHASIEWFKNIVDALNFDHIDPADLPDGGERTALAMLSSKIWSISFYDSLVVVSRSLFDKTKPFKRILGGADGRVVGFADWLPNAAPSDLNKLVLSDVAARHVAIELGRRPTDTLTGQSGWVLVKSDPSSEGAIRNSNAVALSEDAALLVEALEARIGRLEADKTALTLELNSAMEEARHMEELYLTERERARMPNRIEPVTGQ